MVYSVYTDGACNQQDCIGSSAFFIRTEGTFVGQGTERYKDDNIARVETNAIRLAIIYLLKNCDLQAGDIVYFYTDCQSTIDFFSHINKEGSEPRSSNKRVISTWKGLKKLSTLCDWKLNKIEGHMFNFNGNKVADRLAKYGCRNANYGGC